MLFINRINVKSMNHLSRQELVKNRKKSKDLKQPINYHKVRNISPSNTTSFIGRRQEVKKFSSSPISSTIFTTLSSDSSQELQVEVAEAGKN